MIGSLKALKPGSILPKDQWQLKLSTLNEEG